MDQRQRLDALTNTIIGSAIEVHRVLGPGLLESAYEACLHHELTSRGVVTERQKPVALTYRDLRLDCAYRIDLLVEGAVVVEVKALEQLSRIRTVQLLSYLKLTGCPIGLLMNFHAHPLRHGIHRVVNAYPDSMEPLRSLRSSAVSAFKEPRP